MDNRSRWSDWKAHLKEYEQWYSRRHSTALERLWDQLCDIAMREIRFLVGSPKPVFIDVGCGAGRYLFRLAKELRATGIGIEPETSSIRNAIQQIRRDASDVHISRSVGEAIPARAKSVDFALCTFALDHLANPDEAISQVIESLIPGGVFLLSQVIEAKNSDTAKTHTYTFSVREIENLLTRNGFSIIRQIPLGSSVLGSSGRQATTAEHSILRFLAFKQLLRLYLALGRVWPSRAVIWIFVAKK